MREDERERVARAEWGWEWEWERERERERERELLCELSGRTEPGTVSGRSKRGSEPEGASGRKRE